MKFKCVVVLLSCINVSYTCPSGCSCTGKTVDCQYKSLAAIPSGIPVTTDTLYLSNNQITNISAQAFKGLSAVKYLELHFNKITTLDANVFKELTALKVLMVHSNDITEIGADSLAGLSLLSTLGINNNDITTIHTDAFKHVPTLAFLNFKGNNVNSFPLQVFQGLTSLMFLDFGNNPLDCSYCDLESLKLFLKNQTHLGKASAKCNGTNTYVVDHDFLNCIERTTEYQSTESTATDMTTTTTNVIVAMTTLPSNSTNNTGSSQERTTEYQSTESTTTDMTTTTTNVIVAMTTLPSNSTNNTGSSQDSSSITTEDLVLIVVGSVSAVAVVTGIIVGVSYAYSLQKMKSVIPSTI